MAVPYPDAVRNAFRRARNMDGSLDERLEYFAKAVPLPHAHRRFASGIERRSIAQKVRT